MAAIGKTNIAKEVKHGVKHSVTRQAKRPVVHHTDNHITWVKNTDMTCGNEARSATRGNNRQAATQTMSDR